MGRRDSGKGTRQGRGRVINGGRGSREMLGSRCGRGWGRRRGNTCQTNRQRLGSRMKSAGDSRNRKEKEKAEKPVAGGSKKEGREGGGDEASLRRSSPQGRAPGLLLLLYIHQYDLARRGG